MLRTAADAGRLLMVAHVLPFVPEFAFAAEAVRGGKYGKLLGGHFKHVISRPDWSADIGDAAKTGGPAVDLHIHDTHFIGLIAGVPAAVFSSGLAQPDGSVDYLTTQYLYGPGGPAVSCSSGAVAMKGRPFVHGYEIYLEKATLVFDGGPADAADGGRRQGVSSADRRRPAGRIPAEIDAAAYGVPLGKAPDLLERPIGPRRAGVVPQGMRVGANGEGGGGALTAHFAAGGVWKPILPFDVSGGRSIICRNTWAMVLIWSSCSCTVSPSLAICSTSSPGVASRPRSRTNARMISTLTRAAVGEQKTREHGDAVFGEDPGQVAVAAVFATLEVTICDLKIVTSC